MIYPTREDIINLNRRHIENSGDEWIDPENLRNSNSLEWVIEAIQYPLFGIDPYPTIVEKSGILCWIIIDDHIFFDGCKRTALSSMEIFMIVNGYRLNVTGEEIKDIALRIAKRVENPYTKEEFFEWIKKQVIENHFLTIKII
ncbi:MAG: death-on-curing family protein [Chloroflexi bacterium OLB14]|nr:MAG: death-on-curing family protein [Chloroflexi bacterium OLB14]